VYKTENASVSVTEGVESFINEEMLIVKQKLEAKKRRVRRLKITLGTLSALVVLLGGIALYSQYQLRTLTHDELLVDIPQEKQPKTGEEIIKALGRHVVLPEGVPQIAEVQDVDRLKQSQAFFENARNGDVVVVYSTTIYLYRPAQDVLVSYGDITSVK
jgi:hypothetical protein